MKTHKQIKIKYTYDFSSKSPQILFLFKAWENNSSRGNQSYYKELEGL